MIKTKRTNTNILMHVLSLWAAPVALMTTYGFSLTWLVFLMGVLLCVYAKTVPYFIEKKGQYFFKYSPILPSKPIEDVIIKGDDIFLSSKRKTAYKGDTPEVIAQIKEVIQQLQQKHE